MSDRKEKPLKWIASALDDLKEFPEDVQDVMGYALDLAQHGNKHPDAKPLKGFSGAGVLEIVESFEGNAYRAVTLISKEIKTWCLYTKTRYRFN